MRRTLETLFVWGVVCLWLVGPATAVRPRIAQVALNNGARPSRRFALPVNAESAQTTRPTSLLLGESHPRLWLTAGDLPRLRSWATESNPLYRDGLALLAERAKTEMDGGHVPGDDCGNVYYEEYPTEMYAELFAFLSLVENEAAVRTDYANRARTLLMYIMNLAAQGPASEENYTCNESLQYPPFRHPDFATEDRDRARYHGEAFALTVDWIYPSLSAQDKATIRQVFLRWSQEIIERGYHHPEPVGVISDTVLLNDRLQVRFSGNNYFTAHMRNLGLMALALDPADDPGLQLHSYLDNATGAYLYLFDYLTRTDSRGGLLPEGFEYSPQTAGYAAQFLLALRTAGVDEVAGFGAPNMLYSNPFWSDVVTAYFHSLSPATIESQDEGPLYQPAWYGDAQNYHLTDFISMFAPLALDDIRTGNSGRLNAIRWLQTHTPPGGANALAERVRNPDDFRNALLYFMLFDPAAPPPTDPRPALAPDFFAPGLNRLFSRTGWGTTDAWFTYSLSWNEIDHQMADGNQFSFYRHGEWLSKGRTGYADIAEGIASSEFYNTVCVQNNRPDRDDGDWRIDLWQRGSQWNLIAAGNPTLLAHSENSLYAYALGDATNLYNSTQESVTEVTEASRSIVWLKPDHIVVYDRVATRSAGKFKRWWLQLPNPATVSGNRAVMTTGSGQQLFVTSLLPAGAILTPVNANEPHIVETTAANEPMQVRLRVEAPGAPASTRFLHVLQGADAGANADSATLVQSEDGAFVGAAVHGAVVLFPVDLGAPVERIVYTAPPSTSLQLVAGLPPNTGYSVTTTAIPSGLRVVIQPGGPQQTDGGVLMINAASPAARLFLPAVIR